MFRYRYQAVIWVDQVEGGDVVRMRRVSPKAKGFQPWYSPPADEADEADEAAWERGRRWFERLCGDGIPVPEYVRYGRGEENTETRNMLEQLRLPWNLSYVPKEVWGSAEKQRRVRQEQLVQRRYLDRVLRNEMPSLTPHEYQREGVSFVLSLMALGERGSILADEMGLGKTLQALMVVACLRARRSDAPLRVAVICPGFLKYNWQCEVKKWGISDAPEIMKKGTDRPNPDGTFMLASYGWFRTVMDPRNKNGARRAMCLSEFDLVIFDEAQALKNLNALPQTSSQQALAAIKLVEKLDRPPAHCLLLTGTPMPNCPKDVYCLLRMVGAIRGMSYVEFAYRYCKRTFCRMFGSWDDRGMSAFRELLRLQQTHMKRRLAAHHLQLPEEVEVTVNLECPQSEMRALARREEKLTTALNNPLSDAERQSKTNALKALKMEQWRASGRIKIPAVLRYLRAYLEDHPGPVSATTHPFIVFAFHMCVFDAIENMLTNLPDAKKVDFCVVHGHKSKAHNLEMQRKWNEGQPRILLLSLAKSAGLNLQKANVSIFAETLHSHGVMAQAKARTRRQGSLHARTIFVYLMAFDVDRSMCEKRLGKNNMVSTSLHVDEPDAPDAPDENSGGASAKRKRESQAGKPKRPRREDPAMLQDEALWVSTDAPDENFGGASAKRKRESQAGKPKRPRREDPAMLQDEALWVSTDEPDENSGGASAKRKRESQAGEPKRLRREDLAMLQDEALWCSSDEEEEET